ncbi:MAG: single-stranded-DNA-specific exonuclease RecJ [Eubacteriales bacterium]|nr:single-stranded-DNA-specific exonuclease RecJ [Eubacteriales bacterium]
MYKLTQRAQAASLPGYPDYLATLMSARGIRTPAEAEAFLNPAREQLHDPMAMQGMAEACRVIRKAISQGQVIAVYGDYDADGVCASAILLEALGELDAAVFSYIPDRLEEGYGLNVGAIRQISEKAGLIISVDCGITAMEEVRLAKELELDVIITDHHALQGDPPPADALVHPALGDYPFPSLCGAGVAFKLASALLGEEAGLKYLDLAALATIADLVPLIGENRVIASLGLKALAASRRPGLIALMRAAGVKEGAGVSASQVGFQLAPRLNAGGRLKTAEDALRLLLTRDAGEAAEKAGILDALNQERQLVERDVLAKAEAQVKGQDLSLCRSLVVAGDGWNSGVVGLAAGKLAERYQYPAIVLSQLGEELVGSGRSAGDIDLFSALSACAPLMKRFGGHKMAAGMTLEAKNLPAFREAFDQAVREQLGDGDLIPETAYDFPLGLEMVTVENARLLSRLAPFGIGNPAPVFLLEDVPLRSARAVGSSGAHLKLSLGEGAAFRDAIAFSKGHLAGNLPGVATLVGAVEENSYLGRVTAQVNVRALFPGKTAYPDKPAAEQQAMLHILAALPEAGNAPSLQALGALPATLPARGTLLVAWCRETAEALHKRYPQLLTWMGAADDPRAFSAILYLPDWDRGFSPFDRVIMADGLIHPQEAVMMANTVAGAELLACPQSRALEMALESLRIGKDALREAYVGLREGFGASHPAALPILSDLGLVALDNAGAFAGMKDMRRCEPHDSALYRRLND